MTERDLLEREKAITIKEAEFFELKKQEEAFPAILDKSVADACKQLEEKLTTRYSFEKELFNKEMESEIKLLKQTISSLQSKINEQESLISTLNEKTNIAGRKITLVQYHKIQLKN